MKHIRVHELGEPEVMRLEEAPELKPGPGQVLMRVMAAGVNPVDTYVRAGLYGYTPELPYTPGSDAAGVVEAVGDGVRHVAKGDRVYGGRAVSGSYAEQALFDAAHVHPLPDAVTFAQGACLGIPYVTAYAALFLSAKAQPRQTLLVHGASGGVGTAAVQLARQAQVTVIGTAGSEAGRRLVKEQGADVVLDHRDPAHVEELLRATEGRGVDVILEMLANENLGQDLKLLAPEGRVVVIGCRGTVEIDPRELMVRDAAILGIRLKNLPQEQARQIHAHLGEGLRAGTLRPVVGKELPLSEAAEAHRAVMRPPAYGHIVLML
ncbi:MAG: NADPH:quinone reductase [Candidatus Omnitrophota bacterium]|nr:NADPH:quinone reductase [Candidatus Omnitrophota bacterium]